MERVDTEALREWAETTTAGHVRVSVRNLAYKFDILYAELDEVYADLARIQSQVKPRRWWRRK